jgi:hypothetical protein
MSSQYTQVISFKVSPKQDQYLKQKAADQTRKLGKPVTVTNIVRALIQRQMDYDEEKKRVDG